MQKALGFVGLITEEWNGFGVLSSPWKAFCFFLCAKAAFRTRLKPEPRSRTSPLDSRINSPFYKSQESLATASVNKSPSLTLSGNLISFKSETCLKIFYGATKLAFVDFYNYVIWRSLMIFMFMLTISLLLVGYLESVWFDFIFFNWISLFLNTSKNIHCFLSMVERDLPLRLSRQEPLR